MITCGAAFDTSTTPRIVWLAKFFRTRDGTHSNMTPQAICYGSRGLRDVTVDAANRLSTANGDRFAYDLRNHVISRQGASKAVRFRYDSKDMLLEIEDAQGLWKTRYDPLGRRVSKSWGSNSVEFYWDNDRLAAEILHTGSLRLYIYPDAVALVPDHVCGL